MDSFQISPTRDITSYSLYSFVEVIENGAKYYLIKWHKGAFLAYKKNDVEDSKIFLQEEMNLDLARFVLDTNKRRNYHIKSNNLLLALDNTLKQVVMIDSSKAKDITKYTSEWILQCGGKNINQKKELAMQELLNTKKELEKAQEII